MTDMDEEAANSKRQSLYTPPPGRDTKRSKSEEQEEPCRLGFDAEMIPDRPTRQIGEILSDLRDMTDDLNQHQAQVRFLLWQCAEKQRQEASTKVSINNWWKYELRGSRDYFTLECHRKSLIEHYAKEAGIAEGKVKDFTFSNYIGRNLSPFCVVDTGDARRRQTLLEHMKKTHNSKVEEWTTDAMKSDIGTLWSDRSNKPGVNGTLVFEPMIATFDKLQSVPLKLTMAAITELRPDLNWQKDWQQQTIYIPDAQGEIDVYLAWCALDHLHGKCTIFVDENLFQKRAFEEALTKQEFAWTSRKGWGKGKSKHLTSVDSVSKADVLNPQGAFMEQIGLAKGDGKSKRSGYSTVMEKALKSELPFRLEVQTLCPTEFVKRYNDHLYRLLSRWT